MAAVETGEVVEGVKRGWKDHWIPLCPTQKIGEICTPRAGREVDNGAQAAEARAALSLVEIGAERSPAITDGDHRPNSQIGMPATLCGFQ